MRFQRKRMPLISFPRCTVTWVRVQYCVALFAWAERFNKTGIWSKVKAGGAVLAARKAEKQLLITSNRRAAVPRQYYNQPAHLWLKEKRVKSGEGHSVWPSPSCDLNWGAWCCFFHQHGHHVCCQRPPTLSRSHMKTFGPKSPSDSLSSS